MLTGLMISCFRKEHHDGVQMFSIAYRVTICDAGEKMGRGWAVQLKGISRSPEETDLKGNTQVTLEKPATFGSEIPWKKKRWGVLVVCYAPEIYGLHLQVKFKECSRCAVSVRMCSISEAHYQYWWRCAIWGRNISIRECFVVSARSIVI